MEKEKQLIMLEILAGMFFVFAIILRRYDQPFFLGWVGLGFLILTAVLIGMQVKNEKSLVFSILAVELFLTLFMALSFPNIINLSSDELFETHFASTIIENRAINPQDGVGFAANYYGYTPILHTNLAVMSLLSGISPFVLSKFIFIIFLRLVFVLLAYILIRRLLYFVSDRRVAYFAALVFLASPRLFIMRISRRLMGAIFLLLSLYALIQVLDSGQKKYWSALLAVFSVSLIFSDHSQSVLFWLLLAGLLGYTFFLLIVNMRESAFIKTITLLVFFVFYTVSLITWYTSFAVPVMEVDQNYLRLFAEYISGTPALDVAERFGASAFHIYSLPQRLLAYMSLATFAVAALIGTIVFISKNPSRNYISNLLETFFRYDRLSVLKFLIIAGLAFFAVVAVLVFTPWFYLADVSFWLFSIPLSILFAFFISALINAIKKRAAFLIISAIVLFIFAGGFFAVFSPPMLSRAGIHAVEFAESRQPILLVSGRWLSSQPDADFVIGDRTIFDVYTSFFGLNVMDNEGYIHSMYQANQSQLYNMLWVEDYRYNGETGRFSYVVVNNNLVSNPSLLLRGETLDPGQIGNFNSVYYLDSLYSDGTIIVYFNQLSD
jgi:hypothetical protein